MARDFEDLHDLGDLSDDELRRLVHNTLRDSNAVDVDEITVSARDGVVTLEGRVGTEAEQRVAERLCTDVLGIEQLENNLVIDPSARDESPMAIDDHLADVDATEGLLLGDKEVPLSPEAEHLDENIDARLGGTTDVGRAIESGTPWVPPEGPTPEGHDEGIGSSD